MPSTARKAPHAQALKIANPRALAEKPAGPAAAYRCESNRQKLQCAIADFINTIAQGGQRG